MIREYAAEVRARKAAVLTEDEIGWAQRFTAGLAKSSTSASLSSTSSATKKAGGTNDSMLEKAHVYQSEDADELEAAAGLVTRTPSPPAPGAPMQQVCVHENNMLHCTLTHTGQPEANT